MAIKIPDVQTLAYMKARIEYFSDKKVIDLTIEELEEYVKLRKYVGTTLTGIYGVILGEVREKYAELIDEKE